MTDAPAHGRRKIAKAPSDVETELSDWGPKGTALGEMNGESVQIDRGIPGERVLAEVQRGRRPHRGIVRDVLVASPDRIDPPCPYYSQRCGGCQWQHLRYDAQVAWKRTVVDQEMERAAQDTRVGEVWSMKEPWRYRHTAALALGWEAGFRPRGRRGIVEIHDCLIAHPLIGRLADHLNTLLRAGGLPRYHGKVWLDCTVIGSSEEPALQVLIQGIEGLTLENHPELPQIAEALARIEGVLSVAFRHRSGAVVPLRGNLANRIRVNGRWMYVPVGGFFQTNLQMLGLLLDRMAGAIPDSGVRTIADIYGGVGTFGLPLAEKANRVILVELDAQAVEAARRTATEWGLRNVEFIDRRAEQALPELRRLDVAIVDPPRSGLGDTVVNSLVGSGVPRIFYVSCGPASLARDLAHLTRGGFEIESLELFDFYPQTYHVETLAVLRR